jgi:acetylornithine/succinyldiaminopimelate/putrescine aminotransferase
LHTSTYSENRLAMRASLAAFDVLPAPCRAPRANSQACTNAFSIREASPVRDVRDVWDAQVDAHADASDVL